MPGTIIILGMHRSGTSCLTGLLEEAGLYLGSVKRSSKYNAKGNRENPQIMAVNDDILKANAGTWAAPPKLPVIWPEALQRRRDEIIAGYPSDQLWGFKDPRMIFTLDGWMDALPQARLVASIRHPVSVARSLNARDSDISLEQGVAIWMRYNQRLLKLCRDRAVPLICFDWDKERYLNAVSRIVIDLGLKPPRNGFTFFENSLRSRNTAKFKGHEEAEKLYVELNALAIQG